MRHPSEFDGCDDVATQVVVSFGPLEKAPGQFPTDNVLTFLVVAVVFLLITWLESQEV